MMHGGSSRGGSVVVWLRQDLRIHDNPALAYAASLNVPMHVVYIHAPDSEEGGFPIMGAAKMWLHYAIKDVDASLRKRGSGLVCLNATNSSSELVLCDFLLKVEATNLFYNNVCEPWKHARDNSIANTLRTNGINVQTFKSVVLFEPWDARPDTRPECLKIGFGSVGFFRRACSTLPPPGQPLPCPSFFTPFLPTNLFNDPATCVEALKLLQYPIRTKNTTRKCRFCTVKLGLHVACKHSQGQKIDWGIDMREYWDMTENGAIRSLSSFLEDNSGERMKQFDSNERHRADRKSTSIISPYVRFGQLSPRYIVYAAKEKYGNRVSQTFLRRLVWRDLAYWALWRFPDLPSVSFRIQYEHQWWAPDPENKLLHAWQQGKTGYPLVDAAMRQLWVVGWMPNYMRHVVAGFLIEYLNLHWIHGLRWFHKTLVDSDIAINSYMWQNGGHSGMDQWNFVMHPVYAAKTCDPEGDYVRKWVPELQGLSHEFIHCPWECNIGILAANQVFFDSTYPSRVVTHLERQRRRSHKAVMDVRRSKEGAKHVLSGSGHEMKVLPNGQTAVLITRVDYREGKISTRQTADESRDPKRRGPSAGNFFAGIMKSEVDQYHRTREQAMSERMY
jgi:deoxyribodipyrimidine photolyase